MCRASPANDQPSPPAAGTQSAHVETTVCAVLTLDGTGDAEVELELEYGVPGAVWVPAYRLTHRQGDGSGRLVLRASVAQRTGEDWTGVRIALATADLRRRTDLPRLRSIRIGRSQPAPAPSGWREPPAGLVDLFSGYDAACPGPATTAAPAALGAGSAAMGAAGGSASGPVPPPAPQGYGGPPAAVPVPGGPDGAPPAVFGGGMPALAQPAGSRPGARPRTGGRPFAGAPAAMAPAAPGLAAPPPPQPTASPTVIAAPPMRSAGRRPLGCCGSGCSGTGGRGRSTGRDTMTVSGSPWCRIFSGSPSTRV